METARDIEIGGMEIQRQTDKQTKKTKKKNRKADEPHFITSL